MNKFLIGLVIVFVIAFVFVASACTTKYNTRDAWLRDTLFSVEPTRGGNCRIWMTHDDVSTYCTTDKNLCIEAKNLLLEHNGEVAVHYFDIEVDDEESNRGILAIEWSQCGQGIYETKVWGFDEIYPVDGSR